MSYPESLSTSPHSVVALLKLPVPPPNLGVGDAELADEAVERVGVAGRDRDLRHVALGMIPGQRGRRGGERCVLTCGDTGHDELAPPLADLDHEWDVVRRGNIVEREVPGFIGERLRVGAARQARDAAIALHAGGQRPGIVDRHVDRHAEQRQRSVGGIHSPRDRGRRPVLRGAIHDRASDTFARIGIPRIRGVAIVVFTSTHDHDKGTHYRSYRRRTETPHLDNVTSKSQTTPSSSGNARVSSR
ncbi:MAG: hypothetical protein E6J91_06415 [Deltaproteobacteria bacterium]|nr:MAG: hypothetical protein E6J91_06415 [Deltaproteobacteria bacterium]